MSDLPRLSAEDRLEIQELLHRYMFMLDAGEHHDNGYGYTETPEGGYNLRLHSNEF